MTDDSASVAVIVVAAGSGTRLGHGDPKALVPVAGRTVLARALEAVFAMPEPVQVIVVAPADRLADAGRIARQVAGAASAFLTVVAGGTSRQRSVTEGLAALAPGVQTVLVHDAARALTPTAQIEAVVSRVRATGAGVIPGLPIADTVKRLEGALAVETVDRSRLTVVQTPQGFPRDQLVEAYRSVDREHTDDAALFSAAGHEVSVIEGDPLAFKITTGWDLRRAETLIAESVGQRPAGLSLRTGIGIDVHAYEASEPLWLGGLYWPDELGLAGHSDGDAVAHAICDALLSAAGLGDIGWRFGTAEPRYENAGGELFLRETLALVTGAGFRVQNVAVQIVGNHPRVSARRVELEQHLGILVGAPVSVSATTSDGLGFTGRSEGITAVATALLSA